MVNAIERLIQILSNIFSASCYKMVSEPMSCLYTDDIAGPTHLLTSQNFKINLSYATGKITLALQWHIHKDNIARL